DHPASSVVADKFSARDSWADVNFSSLDGYQSYGNAEAGGAALYIEPSPSGQENRDGIITIGEWSGLEFGSDIAAVLDFGLYFDYSPGQVTYINLGNHPGVPTLSFEGMGARLEYQSGSPTSGANIIFYVTNNDGSTVVESDPFFLVSLMPHRIRIFNNVLAGIVECYIDGLLVWQLSWPATFTRNYPYLSILGWTSSGSGPVYINSVAYALDNT